jgi:putative NADH-flavin reductase
MNLIIFGGSGRTGVELVRQALKEGHNVTVFVRDRSKLTQFRDKNLTIIEGDINDLAAVRRALAGQDAALSALGVSKTLRHDPEVVKGIATIVRAMNEARVKRFVYLSVFLAHSKPGQFSFVNNILRRIIRKEVHDHEVKEDIIRKSLDEYCIVRAVRLTDGSATGAYRAGENIVINDFLPSITRADAARFMLQQLNNSNHINKAVLLTGA